jgi:hypothetical protein
MSEHGIGEATAIRLAELSREIDELEKGRVALLRRVIDRATSCSESATEPITCGPQSTCCASTYKCNHEHDGASGNRGRASDGQWALEDDGKAVAGVVFEADGLQDALDEAENELERISTILINGKSRSPRGH